MVADTCADRLGLAVFVVYATVRSFARTAYWVDDYHYLTPFYSPCVSASCVPGSSHFGVWVGELPMWIPLAFVSLPFLLVFRLTCYYYRKAYYRSFWLSPPACAVAEPHATYTGETRFPLIVQNAHRYFFYIGFVISLVNTYDAILAFHSPSGFGFGLGNVILVVNVILLWGYTLSCHSCRHVTGGRLKHFSKHPVRYRLWTWVSKLNARHMQFAWITLGHAGDHRLLHHARRERHHLRPPIHRLTTGSTGTIERARRNTERRHTWGKSSGTTTTWS